MKIINKKIDELKPYKKNARLNDDAVDAVASSISEFGFRVPILIEKDGTIVAGHTRFKACMKLHINEVPCIVVDDLTDEQIRAYRLADNKVAEKADWDFSLLDEEINNIIDIDMSQFGFEFEDYDEFEQDQEKEEKENERVRTALGYNLNLYKADKTEGNWDIPCINAERHIPSGLIGFNYVKTAKNFDASVHFFIDDYQFERVWNSPDKYAELLFPFDCVLTPDFSLYRDMPLSMQLWNVYRSRLLGQYWQSLGIKVIPTVSWCDKRSYSFCFDGLPEKSVLAISSVGILQEKQALKLYKDGVSELIQRKKPETLIVYGRPVKDMDYKGVKTVFFSNSVTDRLDSFKKSKGK